MVKLTGPASSLAASGTLAGLLTFSNHRGHPYMKKKSHTPNPNTVDQVSSRAMFSFLTKNWMAVPYYLKDLWRPPAELADISAINAYIGANQARWRNFYAPTQVPGPDTVLTPSLRKVDAGNWNGNQFNIRTNSAAVNDGWGMILHARHFPDYTPSRSTAKVIILDQTLSTIWIPWVPPIVANTRFKTQPFSIHGDLGAVTNSWNVYV